MQSRTFVALWLLLLETVLAISVSTLPEQLLINAPFRVTVNSTTISSVFVASDSSCRQVLTGGSPTILIAKTAAFQVVFGSVSAQTVYLCDGGSGTQIAPLLFASISFSPPFGIRNTVSTISFSAATPNNAIIEIRELSDCVTGSPAASGSLDASNKVPVIMTSSFFYFMCVSFVSPVTLQFIKLNVGQFVVTDPSNFDPTNVVTNQALSFEVRGAAPPFTHIFISTSSDCSTISQGPLVAGGQFGKTISMVVSVPRGLYTFCIENPSSSGIYIPSGILTVRQFGFAPATIFAERSTLFSPMLDAPDNVTVALSSSSSCFQPFVAGPALVSDALWNISDPGIYYSCASVAGSFVFASTHVAVPQYVVTTDLDTIVRGLSVTVAAVAPGPVVVTLCSGSCSSALFTSQTANSKAVFQIGTGDFPGMMWVVVCVRTVDSSYVYPMLTLPVRSFSFAAGPLIAGSPGTVFFDNETAGAAYGFSVQTSCSTFVMTGSVPLALFAAITFSTSGTYVLCIRTNLVFLPLGTVTVFPVPSTSPLMSITNLPTSVTFSNVPTSVPVSIGTSCFNPIANATSQSTTVTMTFTSDRQSNWVLCVGIPDSSGQATMFAFGNLTFYDISHSPTYHVIGIYSYFAFATQQPSLLSGLSAKLSSASDCSGQGTTPQAISNLTVFQTPQVIGTAYVCVGSSSQQFVSVGADNVLGPITVIPDITPTLNFIPFRIIVSSGNYSTHYFRVSQNSSCVQPIASGNVDSSGLSDSIVVNSGTYFACVTSDDEATLLPAGSFIVGAFQALSTTVAIGTTNTLVALPSVAGASLFLTQAANCSSLQYFTSASFVLSAPPGNYTLCQQLRGGSSPSINTVEVLAPFAAAFPAGPIRQFVPFDIVLWGGDIGLRSTVDVYSVIASEDCLNGTVISQFSSSQPSLVTVVAASGQYVAVRYCIRSVDTQVTQTLGKVVPQPYMSPYSVVAGIPVLINSAQLKFGFALLSTGSGCTDSMNSSGSATVSNFSSMLTIPLTAVGKQALYCESVDGVFFAARGVLNLLHYSPTGGSNTTVGLENRTVLPGRPVALSVPADLGKQPYAVRFSCNDEKVDLSQGYNPQEMEDSSFFVCVLSPDETLLFTTPYRSLSVQHYTLSPRSIGAARSDQKMTLSPPATTPTSFVASSANCNISLVATTSFTSGIAAVNTYASGLLFLCVSQFGSAAVSVASFAAVDMPMLSNISFPIANVPLCFSISIPSQLYSVIPGGDSQNPLASYFQTANRSIFWSSAAAGCLAGFGQDLKNISDMEKVCLNVGQSQSITICAVTPAGAFPVSGTISTLTVSISPVDFVADAAREAQLSNCPNCTLTLSSSPSCADATQLTNSFQVDATGRGNLSAVARTAGSVLTAGNYTLCYSFGGNWFAVDSISLFSPVAFSVSNSAIVSGVASTIALLQDLTTSFLLPGVFTGSSCSEVSTFVNWSAVNSTIVTVSSQNSASTDVFFCAICPVNGSRVVVRRINVLPAFILFPNSIIVCSPAIVSLQVDIGAAQVAVYNRPCCTGAVDKTQVVEQALPIAPSVRSFTVSPNDVEIFSPVVTFNYCFWNSTLCLDLGPATISGAACVPPTPHPPQVTPAPIVNVNSSLLNFLGLAAPSASGTSYTTVTILVVVFGALVFCALLACCLHWYVKSGRVVPADVEEHNEQGTTTWKKSFDSVLAPTLRKSRTSALHVPMDMTLDICREAPMAMQQLDVEEGKQRDELERVEQAVLDEIVRAMYKERQAVVGYSVALERTRIIETVNSLLGLECGEVQAQEDYDRRMLEEDEESNLLQIAEMERSSWRQVMDVEGRRLQLALERDPFWRTRRQQLREANSRALLSTDQAYSPSRNISYSSAGGGSPTPFRTVDAQRRDPRLETW